MLLYQLNGLWIGFYMGNALKNLPTYGSSKDVSQLISFFLTGKYGDKERDDVITYTLLQHGLQPYGI